MSDHDMPDHGYTAIPAEGFMGHKPLPNGKCEHRWRNRQTKAVSCRFADGWHAGQVAALPGLIQAARRYRAAEWAARIYEDEPRMTPEHNARVEEWQAADAALASLLGESSPYRWPTHSEVSKGA